MENDRKRPGSFQSTHVVSTLELTKRRRKKNVQHFQERKAWKNVQSTDIVETELSEEGMTSCDKDLPLEGDQYISCKVLHCQKVFTSVAQFESHYSSVHRHVCSHCKRILTSAHLLDLHILEWHDTMFEFLVKKKPMYECLDHECADKFWTSTERKEHLIMQHKYTEDFTFSRDETLKAKRAKKKEKVKNKQKSVMEVTDENSNQTIPCDINQIEGSSKTTHYTAAATNKVTDKATVTAIDQAAKKPVAIAEESAAVDKTAVTRTRPTTVLDETAPGADQPDTEHSDVSEDLVVATETKAMGNGIDCVNVVANIPTKTGAIDCVSKTESSNTKIPQNICFGHGSQKAFHSGMKKSSKKHWHQQKLLTKKGVVVDTSVNIEEVKMDDLGAALRDVT